MFLWLVGEEKVTLAGALQSRSSQNRNPPACMSLVIIPPPPPAGAIKTRINVGMILANLTVLGGGKQQFRFVLVFCRRVIRIAICGGNVFGPCVFASVRVIVYVSEPSSCDSGGDD
uniref:(northern house mosquito) hypothetical protein n=1 Tax=Culex pipiens TaxID=7175 RepID=A0A8D8FHG7_CULPI